QRRPRRGAAGESDSNSDGATERRSDGGVNYPSFVAPSLRRFIASSPMGFFSKTLDKLKGAVRKTAQILNTDVRTLFVPGRQINEQFLTELEETLLQADLGVKNVERIVNEVRERWRLGRIKNAE